MRWQKLSAEEEIEVASEVRRLEASLVVLLGEYPASSEVLGRRGRRKETTSSQHVERIGEAVRALGASRPRPAAWGRAAQDWQRAEELRWKLAMSGYRIAVGEAKKLGGRGVSLDDLVSEGIVGLLDAAKRFDPGRRLRFSTYSRWWVRARMMRLIDTSVGTVRLPGGLLERHRRHERIRSSLEGEGEWASDEAVAEAEGCSVEEVALARRLYDGAQTISLSVPVTDGSRDRAKTLQEVVCDPDSEDPERAAMVSEVQEQIRAAILELPERHQTVVSTYLGLETGESSTLQEAADVVGLSRERVRQLVLKVERSVREIAREDDPEVEPVLRRTVT